MLSGVALVLWGAYLLRAVTTLDAASTTTHVGTVAVAASALGILFRGRCDRPWRIRRVLAIAGFLTGGIVCVIAGTILTEQARTLTWAQKFHVKVYGIDHYLSAQDEGTDSDRRYAVLEQEYRVKVARDVASWWLVGAGALSCASLVSWRRMRRVRESPWEFDGLAYRELPLFALRRAALTVHYHHESDLPFTLTTSKASDSSASQKILDGLLKHLVGAGLDADYWRASPRGAQRPLLLIDQRVGFLRHVWCVVDVRHTTSTSINVRLHRMTPRHLDVYDVTLFRYLAFPFVAAFNVLPIMFAQTPAVSRPNVASFVMSGFATLALLVLMFGMLTDRTFRITDNGMFGPSMFLLALGVVVGLAFTVFEAKVPAVVMERRSKELHFVVQESLQAVIQEHRASQ